MELIEYLKDIEQQYGNKQAKVEELKREVTDLTITRDKLAGIVGPMKGERDGLQADIAKLKGDLATKREESTKLAKDIAIQRDQLAALSARIELVSKSFAGALAMAQGG